MNKIEKNAVVTLIYDLHAGVSGMEKSHIESTDKNNPFVFIFGTGNLIKSFESNIQGLEKGGKFDFEIKAEDAYGLTDDESIISLPRSIFAEAEGKETDLLLAGNYIPMSDGDGNRLNGKVLEVKDNEVLMDFNHPLAGQDLHFSGEVLSIRAATAQEIEHGHVHEHGHDH